MDVIQQVRASVAQLGERQTEDLKVPGSIPGGGIRIAQVEARVAQSVEHVLGKDEVPGSIPGIGSSFCFFILFIWFWHRGLSDG